MTPTIENFPAWLNTLPLFASLQENDLADLCRQALLKKLTKGGILFLQGEPAENFYVTVSGWIKLFRETGDGQESVGNLCTVGDSFGEAALYPGDLYPCGAQAVEPACVMRIPASVIKGLVQRHSDFAAGMIRAMTQRLETLELQVEHLSLMIAPQRVGCFLLKLCRGPSIGANNDPSSAIQRNTEFDT